MKRLEKIHKASMLKQVREYGKWTGYIAPSKVNSFHINDGWHLGMEITVTGSKEQYYIETPNGIELMENFISNFMYYCDRSLGREVRFWQA